MKIKPKAKKSKCVSGFSSLLVFCAFSFGLFSCSSSDIFTSIGDNLASPINFNIDSATNRLYMVNSNNTVLYNDGSLQVYDISDPLLPALIGTALTNSFSGHAYYDAPNNRIFVANRYSSNNTDLVDTIYRINVNEASAAFLTVDAFNNGSNPFGLERDTATSNVYVADYNSTIDYFDVDTPETMNSISVVDLPLSDGTTLSGADMRDLTILGNQAFITIPNGGIFVLDLNEKNIDYYVFDFLSPRGIVNDGTYIYMPDVEYYDDDYRPLLYVLDPAAFPALTGNTTATIKSKDDSGVVVTSIAVGADNNADPQEALISTNYIFVTNAGDQSVSVINRAGFVRGSDITVGNQPFGMGLYSPGGVDSYLYVGNLEDSTVSIIDMATLTVVETFP